MILCHLGIIYFPSTQFTFEIGYKEQAPFLEGLVIENCISRLEFIVRKIHHSVQQKCHEIYNQSIYKKRYTLLYESQSSV